MAGRSTHIIKRQVLDIQTNVRDNAFQLQTRVRDLYYEKMLAVLEAAFDQYDTGDVLRIDQLTIELGEVSRKGMDEELVRIFENKLHEQLSELMYEVRKNDPGQIVSGVHHVAVNTSDFELVTFFLETGLLPWWKSTISMNELDQIFEKQAEKNPLQLLQFLKNVRHQDAILKRISMQFSSGSKTMLKKVMLAGKTVTERSFLADVESVIEQVFSESRLPAKAKLTAEQFFLEIYLDESGASYSEKKIIQRMVDTLHKKAGIVPQQFAKTVVEQLNSGKTADQKKYDPVLRDTFKTALAEWLPGNKGPEQKETDPVSAKTKKIKDQQDFQSIRESGNQKSESGKNDIAESKNALNQPEKKVLDSQKQASRLKKVEEVYVQNAGLVLIWSYLPFYFRHVGVLVDNTFKDEEAQYHAMHLLHYIATGTDEAPEYELPLNKLLCGIPLHEPVEQTWQISSAEKEEAEKMLEAVITHWSALGNTSPASLRQSFLCRKGMLTYKNNSWVLQVEDSGIDILLGQIPWGFSLVNYKWMEKPIYVEWH